MKLAGSLPYEQVMLDRRALIDRALDRFLPSGNADPKILHEAMRYSVLAEGKRLRPILAMAAHEYCGGEIGDSPDTPIFFAAAALELVHTYSLIHDDLPCMDDDDMRRGRPTCHKKFGEAVAVLAGDALHDVAFELMARTGRTDPVIELAQAIGTAGMIGGQMADMEAESKTSYTAADVVAIHTRKTAALIRCSVRVGALLSDADPATLKRLSLFGEKVGLAFQIIDDILDIEGDVRLLGKQTGADSRKQKATYPGAVGVATARADAGRLIEEGVALVQEKGDTLLSTLARYIAERER